MVVIKRKNVERKARTKKKKERKKKLLNENQFKAI